MVGAKLRKIKVFQRAIYLFAPICFPALGCITRLLAGWSLGSNPARGAK
jgi:hypothetical protein